MNSTISTPFLSQKIVAISFLADSVCLNFIGLLVNVCVCVHCLDCLLVSTFTNETQVSSPVSHKMWLRTSLPSLWYRSRKVKVETILWIFCTPMSIFRTHLVQNCDNPVENSAYSLWKFTQKFWNCEVPSFTNFLVSTLNKMHSLQMADHFTLHCDNLFAHLWTFYTIALQFLDSLHFGCKPCTIHDGFPQHLCFYHEENG
jgi:hypothetical protein